jgi:hypothetical protein
MAMESYYPIGQAPLSSRLISQLSILERSLMAETTSELEPNRRQNYVGLHFPSGPQLCMLSQSPWNTRPTITVYPASDQRQSH